MRNTLLPCALLLFVTGVGWLSSQETAPVEAPTPAPESDQVTDEQRIRLALEEKSECEFVDTPLIDALKFLSDLHAFQIVPLPKGEHDLKEPITLKVTDVPLKSVLTLILRPHGYGFHVKDNMLLVAEREDPQVFTTQVYDVSDIEADFLDDPANSLSSSLPSVILHSTAGPWLDVDGQGGLIQLHTVGSARLLIVRTDTYNHQELADLLQQIRKAKSEHEDPAPGIPREKLKAARAGEQQPGNMALGLMPGEELLIEAYSTGCFSGTAPKHYLIKGDKLDQVLVQDYEYIPDAQKVPGEMLPKKLVKQTERTIDRAWLEKLNQTIILLRKFPFSTFSTNVTHIRMEWKRDGKVIAEEQFSTSLPVGF